MINLSDMKEKKNKNNETILQINIRTMRER